MIVVFDVPLQGFLFRSTENEELKNTVKDILEALPNEFNLKIVKEKFPISTPDSMYLVLHQEVRQYNQLLKCIRDDAVQVLDAIQGIYCDCCCCYYFF